MPFELSPPSTLCILYCRGRDKLRSKVTVLLMFALTPNVCAWLTKQMDITAVVCQNNPPATEKMVWKGKNIFLWSIQPGPLVNFLFCYSQASTTELKANVHDYHQLLLYIKFIKRGTILYKDNLWGCRNDIFCKTSGLDYIRREWH